jgi:O-antigen/teichoic acid export membrane protein
MGATGEFLGQAIASAAIAPVLLLHARSYFWFPIDWTVVRSALRYTIPFVPTLVTAWVIGLSVRVFLERFIGLEAVAEYGVAYKLSSGYLVVVSAVGLAYAPVFYSLAREDRRDEIRDFGVGSCLAMVSIGMTAVLIAPVAIDILLPESYSSSVLLFRLIMVAHMLSAVMALTTNLYYQQAKRIDLHFYVYSVVALVNVTLNLFLIIRYGVVGGAVSTVVTFVLLFVIHNLVSLRVYHVEYGAVRWLFGIPLMTLAISALDSPIARLPAAAGIAVRLLIAAAGMAFVWVRGKSVFRRFDARYAPHDGA